MQRRGVTVALERRAVPGRGHLRRLHAGVFQLGRMLGLDTRAVVRLSEVISVRRWRCYGGCDLEQVVTDFAALASWRTAQLARQTVGPKTLLGPEQEQG